MTLSSQNRHEAVFRSLRGLLGALPRRRKSQLFLLLGLMLVAAIAEVISLGTVLPFLSALVEPRQIIEKPFVQPLINMLGLEPGHDLRWPMTVLFGSVVVCAGAIRLLLVYATARINFGIGHELGSELYRRALYEPYEVHISRNSSEIQAGIQKVDLAMSAISSVVTLVSSGLITVFLVATLVVINPVVATGVLLSFGSIYLFVMLLARGPLAANSVIVRKGYTERVQIVNEGLGGIRDVLLDHTQERFVQRFNDSDWILRRAQASTDTLSFGPRFLVEALGMVLIAGLAYLLTAREAVSSGLVGGIPLLGALAMGAQRVMPLLQQLYMGWSNLSSQKGVLADVAKLIGDPAHPPISPPNESLPFSQNIRFHDVSFRYVPAGPDVLLGIDLCIRKGQHIGLIGNTGGGKSTAIDLLMGLLKPTSGQITVDGVPLIGQARLAWQSHIGHVSQSIYLADCSLAENIAFGQDAATIDYERVRAAAHHAQIGDFIEALPAQYTTQVGERGVRLSGGQRQRIGIARALYKNADVLVFDEATSALDGATEKAVMEGIAGLSKDITVILVAHRVSTLRSCNLVFELRNGRLLRKGSYEDVIATAQDSGI